MIIFWQRANRIKVVLVHPIEKPLVRIMPMENVYDQQSVWDTVQESQAAYGPLPDDFEIPERNTSFNHSDPLLWSQ
jgi:hypothetical protein